MALFSKNYPPEIAQRIPPGQRLVKSWPVLHYGPIPTFDGQDWDLELTGLVENPVTLSYQELRALAERRRAGRHALRDRAGPPSTTPGTAWRSERSWSSRSRRRRPSG